MSCKCGKDKCTCKKVITKQGFRGPAGRPGRDGANGAQGPAGPAGPSNFSVKDGDTGEVNSVTEIVFTDSNATVTSGGTGIANVSLIPTATVWNDVLNLPWFVSGSESIRPQYTIEGNKIYFRGFLYIPLDNSGSVVNVANGNSYLFVSGATVHEASVSEISNANSNNGSPQGRFMTTSVTTLKNLPAGAIPTTRDIVFNNVQCYRRYSNGSYLTTYRSVITLRIGSSSTPFVNSGNAGSGCIMLFSPFNDEYTGSGTPPLGNDPLGLMISRTTAVTAADFISSLDDNPFTVPAGPVASPFAVNAHNITNLGGFIINLEGLFGFLN